MTALTDKLGVNDYGMYFNNKIDYGKFKSNWDYDMQMMSRLPINWIRIGYGYWEANIYPDGSFNFDRLDYAINSALDNGFKIILPFFFTNDGYKTPVSFETGVNDLKSIIKAVVKRYAGKGIYYEGINEINGSNHYFIDNSLMDHIDEAVALNEYFFAINQAYDASSTYIAGSLALANDSHYYKFQELVKRGYFSHGSFGSYHQYVMGAPENGLTNYLHDQDVMNYLKSRYGKLSITELGYGSPSNFNGSYTRQQQSDFTLRQIFLLDMIGAEHIICFTMDNSDKTWALQENYYDAGIAEGKKPSFNLVGNKLQELFIELYGYSFKKRMETDPNDFKLLYRKDGEVDKLVYWTAGTSHVANGLLITSTPQIIDFDETTNDEQDEVAFINLNRLNSSNIIQNYQINLNILKEAFKEVSYFLEKNGLEGQSNIFDDLSQYDKLDRNFLVALQKEIEKIDQTMNGYINTFNSTTWLTGGNYDDYRGRSLFDVGEFKYTLNQYWTKFETNINILLAIINTLQGGQHE